MSDRLMRGLPLLLVVLLAAVSAWVWQQLPEGAQLPLHFNARGEPDRWGAAGAALLPIPLIALGLLGLFRVLPRLDPRGENLMRSRGAMDQIALATTLVLVVVQAMILSHALGRPLRMDGLLCWTVGGLFIVMGNVMGKLRHNYTVGIRLPWTLSSERVWDKTHRYGGRVMVLAGVALVAVGLLPDLLPYQGVAVTALPLAALALIAWRSRQLWLEEQAGG